MSHLHYFNELLKFHHPLSGLPPLKPNQNTEVNGKHITLTLKKDRGSSVCN